MDKKLHIVSFDVPYPPNYGGIIDVFFRIKTLSQLGVEIYLHCFEYGRGKPKELEQFTKKIFYYPRKRTIWQNISSTPFIVKSRDNKQLVDNIAKIKAPILLEGVHCTALLKSKKLIDYKKYVRLHNIEQVYYRNLAKKESNLIKKLFFYTESKKLARYESTLQNFTSLVTVSENDQKFINRFYTNTTIIPSSHDNTSIKCISGKGEYILYHGNFEVNENREAANYIIDEIISKSKFPFIFAGRNVELLKIEHPSIPENLQLISNPNDQLMNELITNAQINLIPTFLQSGLKLKLLNALFKGRFCVVNLPMVAETGLEEACTIFNNTEHAITIILQLMKKEFDGIEIDKRKNLLKDFEPNNTAQKWFDLIFVKQTN